MNDLWLSLPAFAQDLLILVALLLPAILTGAVLCAGFAPGPLVRAMIGRFRWVSLAFVLLIAVSVGMGTGLTSQERSLRTGLAAAADKFDIIVARPGSEITALLAAVYLQPSDIGLIGGEAYDRVATHPRAEIAAPLAFGDSFRGAPIVGTTEDFALYLADGALAEGRMWQDVPEALAGARSGLSVGDIVVPSHGHGAAADSEAHAGVEIVVTGLLPPSGSPWDTAILVPVEQVWETHGLVNGHAIGETHLGPPFDPESFPGTPAIVVHAADLASAYGLRQTFDNQDDTMAFFPGAVLTRLYAIMGDVRRAMSLMAVTTQALVAASILLGLFILSRLFRRQVALLRALGAPSRFILAVVWCFGAALILAGALIGLALGVAAAQVLSAIVAARTDVAMAAGIGWPELHLVAGFLSLVSLVALLPAWAVLRQPVAASLRG
ncbi:FtsX-like permease family protein [Roseicyclus sp. F158]|uniref:FtsX-like permease family protein n=1 Tax=Tropicimonas omnivorans TaxID=3075590 RepID=A0ABU3DCT7_9RHOB|nr:FtsX-like permease family protein [Roseicyclus sp. F158]MDT0681374.1 FtsX-like permease family protein [Roseicyclus sp. F158]